MGFLKRFFSMGSKKSKRKHEARNAEERVDSTGRILARAPETWQQEQEGDVTRLLRSSSAHFAVVSEMDYSSLPPLPHPINSVAHTPAGTPTKPENSVQRRGTYTVKVLERKLESRTEFPNANPAMEPSTAKTSRRQSTRDEADSPLRNRVNPRRVPFTPRDQSRLFHLRQDPSVASLLNMYDDKGRISSTAFSNTPPTSAPLQDVGGREQIKRSGSTLRQLLGEPESANNSDVAEGDISWAERYLGEHAAGSQCSLASTAPVETPKDFLFTDDPCLTKLTMPNATFSSDISQELSINYPVISSMEVEISGTSETVELELDTVSFVEATPKTVEPKTPMRASEVFGFLTERRKSILERQKSQRALAAPPLPYVSLNPSTDNVTNTPHPNHSSPDTSDTSIMTSSAQIHTATVTKLTPVLNPLTPSTDNLNIMRSPSTLTCNTSPYLPSPSTRVHLTGDSQSTVATSSSKIPRGPRPLPATPSSSRVNVQNPSSTSLVSSSHKHPQDPIEDTTPVPRTGTRIPKHVSTGTQDPFTPVRARQQRRVVSRASSVASNDDIENQGVRLPVPKKSRKSERGAAQRDKENSPPSVPLRTIFDKRYPNLMKGEPPSPASSSELSPIAKDMMLNLRKQRMRARDEPRLSISRSSRRNS